MNDTPPYITPAQFIAVLDAMTKADVFDELILSRLLERLSAEDRREILTKLAEDNRE